MVHSSRAMGTGSRIGDYVIDRKLPARAPELVFEGTHVLLPRRARLVLPAVPTREAALQTLRHACILETLRHAAAPRLYECGLLPDHRPFLACELVEGAPLPQLVAAQPLAASEVIALVRELAGVMAELHAHDLAHGGLRSDLIVRADTRWVVTDWSTATPDADRAADVRALGAIASTAWTRAAPGARHRPGAPARLTRLLDRMLADAPDDRPTASDVRAEAELLAHPAIDDDDGTAIEEVEVVLVDISRDPPAHPLAADRGQAS